MKILGIIIGGIILLAVGVFIGQLLLGASVGVGAATGMVLGSQAGVCLAVQSAQDQGLISAQEAELVIEKTLQEMSGKAHFQGSEKMQWITGQKDCAELLAELNESAAN